MCAVLAQSRHECCRRRVHPRVFGHAELHDDWGEVLPLPHRRHRQRPRPRRAGKRTHTYAYGLPRTTPTQSVPQSYRYAGGYAGPTGLYKMGHRYYDPTLGRFEAGISAAAETGVITYAGAVGGAVWAGVGSAVGVGTAVVGSCALGGAAGQLRSRKRYLWVGDDVIALSRLHNYLSERIHRNEWLALMNDAARGVRVFSSILIVGGVCACIAGAFTERFQRDH